GYAIRLMHMFSDFCIGIFGTTIFPVFSALAASQQKELFARNFSLAFQSVSLMMTFAAALVIALALPIVKLILERGAFTPEDSLLTAQLIVFYIIAYAAQTMQIVVVRGFHAHGNTRTPVIATVIAVAVAIVADFLLVGLMGIHGLALATTIGYSLNLCLTYLLFKRHLKSKDSFTNIKIFIVGLLLSILIGFGVYYGWSAIEEQFPITNLMIKVITIMLLCLGALAVYIFILHVLKIPTLKYIREKLQAKRTTRID
ncbi:MAG: lipid II flippase MurJ, partial [bacterium]